jgi:alpha-N-arabinofuranosidase
MSQFNSRLVTVPGIPNLAKTICSVVFALTAVTAVAQTSGQPVTASIDASKTGKTAISPYLYGQFVEHAGGLVYNSLWSEMLDDRKFYYAVGPAPAPAPATGRRGGGGFFGRGVGPGRWNPIGPADSVAMDAKNPFAGDRTPLVTLAGAEPRGIQQTGIAFTQGATYNGRIQLAGDPAAKVSINIVYDEGGGRQTVPLGKLTAAYQKFPFSFKAEKSGKAQLEISGTGTGSFHVGAVSLMPADNINGFRPDVIAALKSLRSGVYRWPGGNYVSAFEWRNAIGDRDKRASELDPVWHALQTNDVGTEEFMTLCKLLGVEAYITVDAGLGDAWSAGQYVEYVNGAATTPMGKQRAANGHPEPYRVRFWGIGNEMWGSYQYGYMPFEQFAHKHNLFAKAMRKVDPSIVLIASGAMPDTMTGSKEALKLGPDLVPAILTPGDWTGNLLKKCFDNIDLISEHYYNYGGTHFSLAEGKQVPNDPTEPITDWMRRPANHVRIKYETYKEYEKAIPELVAHPKPINMDEWAYTGNNKYPTYPAYAWTFHEMFRYPEIFQMAAHTFAPSVLSHDGGKATLNANGLVFKIYRDHLGTIPAEVSGNSPQPKVTGPAGGEQPAVNAGSATFPMDVFSAWTADRRTLTVAVLNPTDVDQPLKLNIAGASLTGKGTVWRLAPNGGDIQKPGITSSPVDSIPESLTLPPYSINIYELAAK